VFILKNRPVILRAAEGYENDPLNPVILSEHSESKDLLFGYAHQRFSRERSRRGSAFREPMTRASTPALRLLRKAFRVLR